MRVSPRVQSSWSESDRLPPELRALVACAQTVLDPARLGLFRSTLSACLSAPRLCETALAHGMLGHLYRTARSEAVDVAGRVLIRQLADLQRAATIRSLRQTTFLLRLLEELRSAGIEAMPIKGPAWAESLYGDATMRVCADLDVIVSYEHVLKAREIVIASGYADAAWYNERVVKWHKEGWGHIEMSPVGTNPFLELHWEVFVSIGCRALQGSGLLGRASVALLLGQDIRSPSWVDGLLIDCVHGTKHEWDTVERMLGLAVRVSRVSEQDWPEVLVAAERASCLRRVIIGIAHVCQVFGTEVPAEIQQRLDGDFFSRAFLRYLRPEYLDKGYHRTGWEDLARLFARFITEDSIWLILRHAAIRVLTPGAEDWEFLGLPRRLEWLYAPLRPVRLAAKWARRLLRVSPGKAVAVERREP